MRKVLNSIRTKRQNGLAHLSIAWRKGEVRTRTGLECGNEYWHYGGDHIIFIGHVERYAYTNRPTLLFCRGKYMRGEPLLPP